MKEHGSIVVYRSRAEAEIDKMIWDNPEGAAIFGYVMLIALVSLLVYRLVSDFLVDRFGYRTKYLKLAWPIAIAIGLAGGIALGKLLGWLILAI